MPAFRILVLSTLLLACSIAQARNDDAAKIVSREQAAALAQQHYPGKIVKVQVQQQYYRIRVLQADGRVVTVLVDGQTGRIKRDGK
ncbi:PepSY domain-containing protein [Rheinheimera muenzenbergensis]|uniref:PepSY domain-containing protein n=1 Tax=Rheinheimera muenzenbergensis TaxID=1193628 RepID=A0ABU8CBM0_9GAMM|nr:PepSY domain-containing protein [Gammaproteobacteria bacterium]MBU1554850.1 PepSY domain-containing protein [Gammaproteobacteria bacterium]MBU2071801.1 PepSY domain-containing protein [Gammaproteobacteria bacterium]MBU2184131.1 PepSY domain-containing protein [Gammaproteobacteria bacterium]MBU2204284.1 PepSY domain-containing protein [Gammaproteobacteria bacterium]